MSSAYRVREFAQRFGARLLWVIDGPPDTRVDELAMYADDQGRLMLFEVFRDGGFEVFVPPTDSNDIEETAAAIHRLWKG